jgi:hypothetical protein
MGGTQSVQQSYVTAHGMTTRDNGMQVDGMDVKPNNEVGNQQYPNFGMMQEVTYQTSSISAETSAGGVRINMIPRDGGNLFSGEVYFNGSNGWQSNNVTPELMRRGVPTPTAIENMYDLNPAAGGPFRRDKLWFFGSYRRIVLNSQRAGAPVVEDQWIDSGSLRLTWQANSKNKVTFYHDRQWKGKGHDYDGTPAEVALAGVETRAMSRRNPRRYYVAQAKWTSPLNNRLLLETGLSASIYDWSIIYQPDVAKERGTPEWYAGAPRVDFARGTLTTASTFSPQAVDAHGYQLSSALSYVTGSHNLKTGVQWKFGPAQDQIDANADLIQRYRNGVPENVDVLTTPVLTREMLNADLALYAQDSWTIRRLTINPGVRFEYLNASIEATSMPAGRFVPARQVQQVSPIPPWFNVAPRFSAVYDLFGNARTALKASASKYNQPLATGFVKRYNPTGGTSTGGSFVSDRRDWFDVDLIPGTSIPSGRSLPTNGDDIAQNSEIGPTNDSNFGFASSRRPDENLRREYNLEYSLGVQHQLLPRVSVTGAWYRRQFYNLEGQRNVLVGISDYTAFQTSNPMSDELITIYNLNRAKQGLVDIVDRNSDTNSRVYSGYELSFTGKLPAGGTALGGWAFERTVSITCDTADPNQLRFCDQTGTLHQDLGRVETIPYRHEYKLAVAYPLPWGIQTGLSLLSYPGNALSVSWPVPPSLFPGGRTQAVAVQLVPPNTRFLKRWNQLDISVKRNLALGRIALQPVVEIFNLLNSSVVLTEIQTFGPLLGRPTSTIQGRLLKLGVVAKF